MRSQVSGLLRRAQEQGEAVVAEIDVADGQPGDGFEAVVEFVGPGADVGLAVIGLGEDVGDPEGDEPAEGESLMVGVWLEVLVEELGEAGVGSRSRGSGGRRRRVRESGGVWVAWRCSNEAWGKASLYRRGGGGRKIQGEFM